MRERTLQCNITLEEVLALIEYHDKMAEIRLVKSKKRNKHKERSNFWVLMKDLIWVK